MRLYFRQVLSVESNYLLDSTCHQRLEVVAVQSETLAHIFVMWRQFGSEPIESDLIVVVEVLQHSNDLYDRHFEEIFLFLLMQSHSGVGVVDPQNQMQPGSVDDVS